MSYLIPPQSQVVFMAEHMTSKDTNVSMRQCKEVIQCVGSQQRTICKNWTNCPPQLIEAEGEA